MSSRSIIFALLATVAAQLSFAAPAAANDGEIPAFARRYRVSCNLCHAPMPALSEFGETFAGNGFRLAPNEPPRDTIATGDRLLELAAELPLAIRLDAFAQLFTDGEAATDFEMPYNLKILSGGPISGSISYYLYFFLFERGEVGGIEDAFVYFNDIGGAPVDVAVGQFQVSDPLFKRELRLEFEDYQAYRVRVGDARADLTYDRGLLAAISPWEGGDLSVQVVNGRGIGAASEARVYDEDDGKNIAARVSHSFGPVRIGGFGYFGSESADGFDNGIRVFGPDISIAVSPMLALNAQYLRRTDEYPFYSTALPTDTEVDMGFAELIWSPEGATGRWFFTGLYNFVEADAPIFTVRQGETGLLERYRTAALGGNYLLARNLRLTAEVQYDVDRDSYRFVTGFVSAF